MKLTPEKIEEFESLVFSLRSPSGARPRREISAATAIEQLLEDRRGLVDEMMELEEKAKSSVVGLLKVLKESMELEKRVEDLERVYK